MPRAYSLLPDTGAHPRHAVVLHGLARAGWRIETGSGEPRDARDILLTRAPLGRAEAETAGAFQAAGGQVVVCADAFIPRVRSEAHLALMLYERAGPGRWRADGPERWESFGIGLRPWRRGGRAIVVTVHDGLGGDAMAAPPLWHLDAAARLRQHTGRPIVFQAQGALDPILADAHALVTWAGERAVPALIQGVPVFYEAPTIVAAGACRRGLDGIEAPYYPDRLPSLERLAWAQWSLGEIADGAPFRHLLAAPLARRGGLAIAAR